MISQSGAGLGSIMKFFPGMMMSYVILEHSDHKPVYNTNLSLIAEKEHSCTFSISSSLHSVSFTKQHQPPSLSSHSAPDQFISVFSFFPRFLSITSSSHFCVFHLYFVLQDICISFCLLSSLWSPVFIARFPLFFLHFLIFWYSLCIFPFPFFAPPFISAAYLIPNASVHFPIISSLFFLAFLLSWLSILSLLCSLLLFSDGNSGVIHLTPHPLYLHAYRKKSLSGLSAQTPLGLSSELLPRFAYCIPAPLLWVWTS